jgi:hypothetical protein
MPLAEKGAQRWTDPERGQRSESQLTGLINITPLIVSNRPCSPNLGLVFPRKVKALADRIADSPNLRHGRFYAKQSDELLFDWLAVDLRFARCVWAVSTDPHWAEYPGLLELTI